MTGGEVQALRRRLGVTPKELADLLGVSQSTVYRWEYVDKPRIDPGSLRVLSLLGRFDGARNIKRLRELLSANDGLSALLLVLHSLADNDWIVRKVPR